MGTSAVFTALTVTALNVYVGVFESKIKPATLFAETTSASARKCRARRGAAANMIGVTILIEDVLQRAATTSFAGNVFVYLDA